MTPSIPFPGIAKIGETLMIKSTKIFPEILKNSARKIKLLFQNVQPALT
jgi:hypothetical protein